MSLSWEGFEGPTKVTNKAWKGIRRGLELAGDRLVERMLPITPMEFGPLREGYRIEVMRTAGMQPHHVSYIKNIKSYAAHVHEMPSTTNWTTPGTGPKYMERVLDDSEARKEALNVLASMISAALAEVGR